ncbi:MAG: peptidoglycan-binding protein [Clostridia bacterium]|nr:peptidoglycan-binding protein [Clostridia bacterium]
MKKKFLALTAIFLALLMIPVFSVTASDRVPYKGLDVSKWQSTVDWQKAKAAGVDFSILRVYAKGKDTKFDVFYSGATVAGVWVGAYVYMYALTEEEAVSEARNALAALEGRPLDFPLFLDVEDNTLKNIDKTKLTDMVLIELEIFEAAGYRIGIYTSTSFEKSYMEHSRLADYDFWYAKWSLNGSDGVGKYVFDDQNPYERTPGGHMWQFSSYGNGSVLGTGSSRVDLDYCYYDYMGNGRSIYPYISPDPDDYAVPERVIDYASGAVTYGVDSAWVQTVLNVFGYALEVDGSFGPASKRAVTAFQTAHGLSATGNVDDLTRISMIALWSELKKSMCKFSYEPAGGAADTISSLVSVGNSYILPECDLTKENSAFIGWSFMRASDGEFFTDSGGKKLIMSPGEQLYVDSSWIYMDSKTEYILTAEWECTHVYGDGIVTVEPTPTAPGEIVYVCTLCGDVRTEVLSPLTVPGDANGDGRVTMSDVLVMRKHIAGVISMTGEQKARGDITGDGLITMSDVLKIRKKVAGID